MSFGAPAAGEAALRLEVMGRGGDLTRPPWPALSWKGRSPIWARVGRVQEGAGGVKILIADDDVIPRRFLQTALLKAGHEVVVARDGSRGLVHPARLMRRAWLSSIGSCEAWMASRFVAKSGSGTPCF